MLDLSFSTLLKIFVCVMILVCQLGAASLTQIIQTDYGFNNPFFLNYFSTSFTTLLFIFQAFYYFLCRFQHHRSRTTSDSQHFITLPKGVFYTLEETFEGGYVCGYFHFMEESTTYRWKHLLLYSLPLALLWFIANYFFSIALGLTNIASSMSLEQSTTIFVFILSVLILKERLLLFKIVSIGLCILGVILIAVGDQMESSGSGSITTALLGDILVLISAAGASAYMVTYKKLLQGLPTAIPAVNTLLGLIGFWNIILFWPGLFILPWASVENYSSFEGIVVWLTFASALLSLSFNFFLNYGIILTSPLFMRVVIICGVPASFVMNFILYGMPEFGLPVFLRCLGAAIIIIGFILFTWGSAIILKRVGKEEEKEKEKEKENENIPIKVQAT